jgi:hypothetical protein
MGLLIQNPNIVEVLDVPDLIKPDDLIYTHIFPYLKIPKIQITTETYITMSLNTTKVTKNKAYKDFILMFCIYSHEAKMQTDYGGTRNDVLGGEIVQMFAWNDKIGFDLELISDKEDIYSETYHRRTIVFQTITSNSMQNGMRING